MKCLRCGMEVNENDQICKECGYDLEDQRRRQVMKIDVDPDLSRKELIKYTIFPLITFITALLCCLICMYQVMLKKIAILLIILYFVSFGICFFFSTRKCLVKMKPVREFGIVLSYISLSFFLIKIFTTIFQ